MRSKTIISFMCSFSSLLFFLNTALGQDILSSTGSKGKDYYEAGELEKALEVYKKAQIENPDSPELAYNIGNVLYKQGKFDEATKEYMKALSAESNELKQNSYYNIGNSLFRMGAQARDQEKLAGAIESYKHALQVTPDDVDAKHNMEFVKQFLEQMQQQQLKNQDQDEDQKDQKNQQQQSQQQDKQDQENPDQNKEQQNQQQNQPQDQQQQQQAQPQEGKMSKEEAERLLEALKNEDKEFQKQKLQEQKASSRKVEKDW